ncbi:signal recognition particle-docking protein FtsY [Belnapia sp. T6]|uniref:Signal recognition particle receptor FtsY n=1 Tax=Belnapia mucosa TaxID=2804532 RepID=A0ABS1V4Z0_9PROT|nr:signal recognition particle-docking protein FtsY [Belnapia mucosa]MBL6456764.1 signal recognition particle-docking protein FtsY [Belnapia mucosa]
MALKDWLTRLRGKAPTETETPLSTPPGQLPEPEPPTGAPTLFSPASPGLPIPPVASPPPFTAQPPLSRIGAEPEPAAPPPSPPLELLPPQDNAGALREAEENLEPEEEEPEAEPTPEAGPAARAGWLSRLRAGLSRSTARLTESVTTLFRKRRLDEEALEELEETLIAADLGVAAARRIVEGFRKTRFGKEVTDEEVKAALAEEIAAILAPVAAPMPLEPARAPHVVLVVGVNGTGKTTTIAKLGQQYREGGLRCAFVAGDTFRAAAVEQLQIWGDRTGARVHAPAKEGADAAGLAFDALTAARADGTQVLLVDTAGRLHNKSALMEELRKVIRVIKRVEPEAPHSVLLVLDATTGQNALQQVKVFKEMVDVTGLAVTKLDGSAKGGVVVALAQEFGLPVHFVGVGEKAGDLRPFEARDYARGLVGLA